MNKWICPECNENNELQFDTCWKCSYFNERIHQKHLIEDKKPSNNKTNNKTISRYDKNFYKGSILIFVAFINWCLVLYLILSISHHQSSIAIIFSLFYAITFTVIVSMLLEHDSIIEKLTEENKSKNN